jgi:large subunit ribosomal protein L19e
MVAMQKRLAAQILKCSPQRIRFDTGKLEEIKGAITKHDIRNLIKQNAIYELATNATSRVRARIKHIQRRKRRQKGAGKRKGSKNARYSKKRDWIAKTRSQKALLAKLRDKKILSHELYRNLYLKVKGGFFRSMRHMKLHINEQLKQ